MTEECLHVLLVEDDPAHAEAIRRAFDEGRGCVELFVAASLSEYHASVARQRPHVALMDLNLPDGRAVDALPSPPEAGEFPVVIMTSFGDEQVAVEAIKAGALDYIVKSPEAFATMPRIVERLRREWELLRARSQDRARIEHLNSVLRGIRKVNQLITREREPHSLIRKVCQLLVDSRGFPTSCIVLCSDSRVRGMAIAGEERLLGNLREMLSDAHVPECVRQTLARSGATPGKVVTESRSDYPESHMHREEHDAATVRLEHEGRVYGALIVALPSGFTSNEEEMELLEEIACDVAFALRNMEINAEKEKSEEDLAESREALKSIFERLRDGVLVTAIESRRLVFANEAMCSMLGYAREELLHMRVQDIHPTDRLPEVVAQFERQARGESPLLTDVPILRKDGSVFEADVSSTTVDLEGHPCVVGVFRDRTEQRKLEEHVQLVQRLEAVGRLAGGVAHDFNNLLSVIISYSEFAIETLSENDSLHSDMVEIDKAARRAAALTRQLLAFSRKQVLELEVLDLNRVVSGIENMLRRILGEDIEVVVRLAGELGSIKADRGQLEQVIMNLAVNARDAMPQGGKFILETSNIELCEEYADLHVAVTPGRFVALSASDTGCGMDPATQEHIFEPFFTTKEKGKGTGLGLSTVYGIVKQSGGNVWVYSEVGRGTTFKVYLPRVDTSASEIRRKPGSSVAHGNEAVLIVEDEEAVRRIAERILRAAGYQVFTAASGSHALALCEERGGAFDLLLTDVIMPQVSGRELAEQLTSRYPTLRVLYMSGYADDAIVHHGVLAPGMHFIGKPFSAAELRSKVREVLDRDTLAAAR